MRVDPSEDRIFSLKILHQFIIAVVGNFCGNYQDVIITKNVVIQVKFYEVWSQFLKIIKIKT